MKEPLTEQLHVAGDMTGTPPNSPDQSVGAVIDSECDRFESEWKNGAAPSIAEYIGAFRHSVKTAPFPADSLPILFRELLLIDLAYRERRGQSVSRQSYEAWPEFAAIVDDVFAGHRTSKASVDPTHSRPGKEGSDETVYQARPGAAKLEPDAEVANANPALPDDAPRRLGDYELLEELGRGGMGVVYRARHRKLNRIVALKTTRSGPWIGDNELKRFEREARAAANLDHPGIMPVYEIGEHEGTHYLAMPIAAQSLASKIQSQPLEPREAAEMGLQLADAVAAAHEAGIIHRDLKPHNILLLKDGRPQVADFGLAKPAFHSETSDADDAERQLTRTGQVVGTPNYMPPEQAKGQPVDERADIYSLGATFYAMLTARAPFEAPDPVTVLSQVIDAEPPPPRKWRPGVPKDLEAICLTCLEKRKERRYQSMSEVAADIKRYLAGDKVQALRNIQRARRRQRRVCAGAVTALLALLFLPQLLTMGPARHFWLGQLSKEAQLEVQAQSLHASWWGPLQFRELVVRTHSGDSVAEAKTLEVDRSLWSMWRGTLRRGRIRIARPQLTLSGDSLAELRESLHSTAWDTGLLGFCFDAKAAWKLELEQLSCTMELRGESPQVVLRNWTASLDMQSRDGAAVISSTAPVSLEMYVTPSVCNGLKYALPMVDGATLASGKANWRLDSFRLSLNQWGQAQAAGQLELDFEATAPGLLLDGVVPAEGLAWQIDMREGTRVQCELRNGRVYHRSAECVLIEPLVAAVETRGSVGWDESLELEMNVQLPDDWVEDRPMLASLASTDIPIGGTLDRPNMEWTASSAISGAKGVMAGMFDVWRQREPASRIEFLQRFRQRLQRPLADADDRSGRGDDVANSSSRSHAVSSGEPADHAALLPPVETPPAESLIDTAEEPTDDSDRRRRPRRGEKKVRIFGRGKARTE